MTAVRRTSDIEPQELEGAPVRSRRVITAADGARLGLSQMQINGEHPLVVADGIDIVYYVLEGTGWFEIHGARSELASGDVILVPAGTPYRYGGELTYLNIQSPPITPTSVRWLGDIEDEGSI